jgi:hypothetical protein
MAALREARARGSPPRTAAWRPLARQVSCQVQPNRTASSSLIFSSSRSVRDLSELAVFHLQLGHDVRLPAAAARAMAPTAGGPGGSE